MLARTDFMVDDLRRDSYQMTIRTAILIRPWRPDVRFLTLAAIAEDSISALLEVFGASTFDVEHW